MSEWAKVDRAVLSTTRTVVVRRYNLAPQMSLACGDRLGPYEIIAPVGQGGMGEVYRAKDI